MSERGREGRRKASKGNALAVIRHAKPCPALNKFPGRTSSPAQISQMRCPQSINELCSASCVRHLSAASGIRPSVPTSEQSTAPPACAWPQTVVVVVMIAQARTPQSLLFRVEHQPAPLLPVVLTGPQHHDPPPPPFPSLFPNLPLLFLLSFASLLLFSLSPHKIDRWPPSTWVDRRPRLLFDDRRIAP